MKAKIGQVEFETEVYEIYTSEETLRCQLVSDNYEILVLNCFDSKEQALEEARKAVEALGGEILEDE